MDRGFAGAHGKTTDDLDDGFRPRPLRASIPRLLWAAAVNHIGANRAPGPR